ncbi:hypothetical protein DFH09DRAFT_1084569 [Mycena vulgaris]|nr:hypothetical protein DFH09DRAFT_1084569 [Mycena vulgaris]
MALQYNKARWVQQTREKKQYMDGCVDVYVTMEGRYRRDQKRWGAVKVPGGSKVASKRREGCTPTSPAVGLIKRRATAAGAGREAGDAVKAPGRANQGRAGAKGGLRERVAPARRKGAGGGGGSKVAGRGQPGGVGGRRRAQNYGMDAPRRPLRSARSGGAQARRERGGRRGAVKAPGRMIQGACRVEKVLERKGGMHPEVSCCCPGPRKRQRGARGREAVEGGLKMMGGMHPDVPYGRPDLEGCKRGGWCKCAEAWRGTTRRHTRSGAGLYERLVHIDVEDHLGVVPGRHTADERRWDRASEHSRTSRFYLPQERPAHRPRQLAGNSGGLT